MLEYFKSKQLFCTNNFKYSLKKMVKNSSIHFKTDKNNTVLNYYILINSCHLKMH